MRTKRIISMLLAAVLMLGVVAGPAALAAQPCELETQSTAVDETNEMVSIRISPEGDLVYGSGLKLNVETDPEGTQYLGVIIGVSGEANGFVTLILSQKIRKLLTLIPVPKVMSKTPDQEEEFTLYLYLKQLIDGNDASILIRVADETVAVMDSLKFYMPSIKNLAAALKLALNLIREFVPEDTGTRIYLDEQPTEEGNYVAGAVAMDDGDINSAGVALFRIKPKSEGVSLYWASDVPESMTVEEAQNFNSAAVLNDNGTVVENAKITYAYKKKSGDFFGDLFGTASEVDFPTEPGEYTQTATATGNYSTDEISRTIIIK